MLLKRLKDLDELYSTLKPFFTITKLPSQLHHDLNQLGILVLYSWLFFSFVKYEINLLRAVDER